MTETFQKIIIKKCWVLFEYPRKGVWAVDFATRENKTEMSTRATKRLINVLFQQLQIQQSGFLLMFPADEVIYYDFSSKFIVSAGIVSLNNIINYICLIIKLH